MSPSSGGFCLKNPLPSSSQFSHLCTIWSDFGVSVGNDSIYRSKYTFRMLRVASFTCTVAVLLGLAAFRIGGPKFLETTLPANSTLANAYQKLEPCVRFSEANYLNHGTSDFFSGLRILMLNTTSYDSAYVIKMKNLITKQLPGATLTDCWDVSPQNLTRLLASHHIVVITYPAKGSGTQVRALGKALKQFVQQGGAVVISGTDQFGILQHYGLFDLDFGYFCSGMEVHEDALDHPVLAGTPPDFFLENYVYPLDISDPNFIVLADIHGYPATGFKSIGNGKVVYLGLEYYYDEPVSTRILENTLRWLAQDREEGILNNSPANWSVRATSQRNEERLFAGSGNPAANANTPAFELKLYPNPYYEKGTLDITLEKSAQVSVEMTNETGGLITVLLPYRTLNQGFYRFELPNLASGVYFIKCQISNQTTVKKVVKMAPQ